MEKCPACNQIYKDEEVVFCVNDGTRLVKIPTVRDDTVSFYDLPDTKPPSPARFPSLPTPSTARRPNYFLIFGGIGAAVVILAIGAAVIVFLAIKLNSVPSKPIELADTDGSQTPAVQPASEKYKPELTMAIKSADDAQANAYVTYDTTPLHNYYSGEALKSSLTQVDSLKKAKNFQSSDLENQEFEYFKVNEAGTEAEVRVVETWSTMLSQTPSGRCLALYKSQKQPQNIYLKKADSGWMVDVIVYDAGTKLVASPCPKIGKR